MLTLSLRRSTLPFEPLFAMMEDLPRWYDGASFYPSHDVEKLGDDRYRLTVAVPGFGEKDLSVEASERELIVRGRKSWRNSGGAVRSGATSDFELRFPLDAYMRVMSAHLEHGLLTVDLQRDLPAALKPRQIPIRSGSSVLRLPKPERRGDGVLARAKRLLTGRKAA